MTTTTRQDLALALCDGMTDADLAKRGKGAFLKMKARKDQYKAAFTAAVVKGNDLIKVLEKRDATIAQLQAQVAELQAKYEALLNLDAPVSDTSAAAALLAGLGKKAD